MTKQPFVLTELVEGASLRRLLDALARALRRVPLDLALFIGSKSPKGSTARASRRGSTGAPSGLPTSTSPRADVLLSWLGGVKLTTSASAPRGR